jgi:hypothetical protein
VLIDEHKNVCRTTFVDVNVNDWQPYLPHDVACKPLTHCVAGDLNLPQDFPAGTYRLGLWIPDGADKLMHNARFAIRCANGDVDWLTNTEGYGINVLGEVEVL